MTATHYDLAFGFPADGDEPACRLLSEQSARAGLKYALIDAAHADEWLKRWEAGDLSVGLYVDHASDFFVLSYPYCRLAFYAKDHAGQMINRTDAAQTFSHKGRAHVRLAAAGLPVPFSVAVPWSEAEKRVLSDEEVRGLGSPFYIKPCRGFAGYGVIGDARGIADVKRSHTAFQDESYLLQRAVTAARVDDHVAHFRVFYILGAIVVCWWDPGTRQYALVSESDQARFGLGGMPTLVARTAGVSGMELFTSELVLTPERQLVFVDYINDLFDLRPQSRYKDGVPDTVLETIARKLVGRAAELSKGG